MPGVHRRSDLTQGHSCSPGGPCGAAPPTIPATYSPNVFANSLNVVRFADSIVPHPCLSCANNCSAPCAPHSGNYVGSHNVYVNSRMIQTQTDPITCKDAAQMGSSNVIVN